MNICIKCGAQHVMCSKVCYVCYKEIEKVTETIEDVLEYIEKLEIENVYARGTGSGTTMG